MNNLKDRITDGIGLGIWLLAGYLLYCGRIDVWPGFILMLIPGAFMFYVEDEWVTKHLKEWIKKKFS